MARFSIYIDQLSSRPAHESIAIQFKVDGNGILTVIAIDKRSMKGELVVCLKSSLSNEKIAELRLKAPN